MSPKIKVEALRKLCLEGTPHVKKYTVVRAYLRARFALDPIASVSCSGCAALPGPWGVRRGARLRLLFAVAQEVPDGEPKRLMFRRTV